MSEIYGDRYMMTKDQPLKEVAKHVRADIRTAQEAGILPIFKARVRSRHYTGGSSLRIEIMETPGLCSINPDFAETVARGEAIDLFQTPRYTAEGYQLLIDLYHLIYAYNHFRTYHSTKGSRTEQRFHPHVLFSCSLERAVIAQHKQRVQDQRAALAAATRHRKHSLKI